jgi:ribonuclease P protein component
MRVRRFGKSYAHPLIVLIIHPGGETQSRCAVIAGRSIGKSVIRNRAKRLMREGFMAVQPQISPGWDILLYARRPIVMATFPEIIQALTSLLTRAQILINSDDNGKPPEPRISV